jgi:hypothetical protein
MEFDTDHSQSPQAVSCLRIRQEMKTIKAMILLYCKKKHQSASLCNDCKALYYYAQQRLRRCPFQEKKPNCGQCVIHCYNKGMREKVVEVMRFAGPRMIVHYPLMALRHIKDQIKYKPKPLPKSQAPETQKSSSTDGKTP